MSRAKYSVPPLANPMDIYPLIGSSKAIHVHKTLMSGQIQFK